MAVFDSVTVVVATTAMAAAAVSGARRSTGAAQRFLLALFGISLLSLIVMAPYLAFEWLAPVRAGLIGVSLLAASQSGMMILHLPSMLILGVDENLERHGRVVTTAGCVADLILWATLGRVATWLYASKRARLGVADRDAV